MPREKYPIRIITLPSMTVAAIHVVGQDENGNHAEHTGGASLGAWGAFKDAEWV